MFGAIYYTLCLWHQELWQPQNHFLFQSYKSYKSIGLSVVSFHSIRFSKSSHLIEQFLCWPLNIVLKDTGTHYRKCAHYILPKGYKTQLHFFSWKSNKCSLRWFWQDGEKNTINFKEANTAEGHGSVWGQSQAIFFYLMQGIDIMYLCLFPTAFPENSWV